MLALISLGRIGGVRLIRPCQSYIIICVDVWILG